MANYIQQLQATVKAQEATIAAAQESIGHQIAFLHSDKFSGVESDGSRKDWISTADVLSFLQALRSELSH